MKKIYQYIACSILVITLHACKKELGALPKNSKVDANTILDQSTAQIALNGAYYNFANATAMKTGWQQHQVLPTRMTGYLIYGYGLGSEDENNNARMTSYYWSESYKLLNAANGVLKGISLLDDGKFSGNRKKEIVAESKFLRAYAHFKLLTYYAEWYKMESAFGVLLRDELSTLSNISKARSTVKDSYDFILADLDDVIANGPVGNPNHYVTKWAGMALKLRVLMCRGGSSDYSEIINLATNLIQNSPYLLEANAADIFHKNGLASKEVILGVVPQANQEKDYYSKSSQYWPGASSLYVATAELNTLLTGDPRQSWMIGTANPSTSAPNTFFFTKHMIQNTTPTRVSEADYALRLTEVYLLQAEAVVRSGGSLATARSLVHLIQSKAGITEIQNNAAYLAVEDAATADALLFEIHKENVKSLMAEDGMEWLSLLRQPFSRVQQLKPTIDNQTQFILPVPSSEFIYNPLFGEQNPGYNKTAN
ncbi:hypothetical protein PBAL39_14299 [Pedobacter sp. BAL39]|uniref:RagB/SusD family nutrient uptake outer membrane protein n=1 Tax=Pedobacter sp. BAL39 TaxID=391596 RepID=UPI000155AD64|nr:RagB/SusD family nutrient uptake outer membrane protein [Pedobacter sp. BAL39]EDM34735.1 hypothetical protein PBAL39_14299 [Pedobacter sp. BAL39]